MTPTVSAHFSAAGATNVGQVRTNNEDAFLVTRVTNRNGAYDLWVVADGMGGGAKGEVASQLAVETLAGYLLRGDWHNQRDALRTGFQLANLAVFDRGTAGGEATRSIMGTTLVAALLETATARFWVGNVGDSRAYLLGAGGAEQITRDHSVVAERVRAGELTAAAARAASDRNIITRAIGIEEAVEPDIFECGELRRGERLLLCSDGLHGLVQDDVIASLSRVSPLADLPQSLTARAFDEGGFDNVTAVVGGFADDVPAGGDDLTVLDPAAQRRLGTSRRVPPVLVAVCGAALVASVLVVASFRGGFPFRNSAAPTPSSTPSRAAATISPTRAPAVATVPPTSAPAATPIPLGGDETYTVKSGDTCGKIATAHKLDPTYLETWIRIVTAQNSLNGDCKITLGARLQLPNFEEVFVASKFAGLP